MLAQQKSLLSIECEILIELAQHFRKTENNLALQYSLQSIELANSINNSELIHRATSVNRNLIVSN